MVGPYVQQMLDAAGLSNPNIPQLTPRQAAEARQRMLDEQRAAHPPLIAVAPPAVPERFVDVRWGNTEKRADVAGYRAAVKAMRWWQEEVAAGRHAMVALIGPPGTSKSHLVACAVWWLYEQHRIRVPWHPWYDLVDHLRYGRGGHTEHAGYVEVSAAQVRAEWHRERWWVVDELAPTSGTDFDSVEMRKATMQRYDHKLSAALTCNWSDLADMVGKAAADRYTQVTLDGPSYRGT